MMAYAVLDPMPSAHRPRRYPDRTGRGRIGCGRQYPLAPRADTMDRLKLALAAGITQFIDLTDESELPSYSRYCRSRRRAVAGSVPA
jgi:hypothetical protein